jgi:hypothetical protein
VAEYNTERVRQAQAVLFRQLMEKEAELVARYAEDKVEAKYLKGEEAFQIHRGKILNWEYSQWLIEKKLAWNSRELEEQDLFNWLTVHPNLGSAIMTVLALAIAKQDGLIVTPSNRAHDTLLGNSEKQIFAKLLDVPLSLDEQRGHPVGVQELCQLVVLTGFDLTRLTPADVQEAVVKGGSELRTFYGMLSTFSDNISPDLDEKAREKKLKAKADEALGAWRKCNEKLPQLGEAVREASFDKGIERAVEVVKDSWGAQFAVHSLGGLSGIALAIIVKAGSIMVRGHDTPYRYLNRINKIADKRIGELYSPQWRKLAS